MRRFRQFFTYVLLVAFVLVAVLTTTLSVNVENAEGSFDAEGDEMVLESGFIPGEMTIDQLRGEYCNKRIGVLHGSFESNFLHENCPKVHLVEYNDDPDIFAGVQSGRLDLTLTTKAFGKSAISQGARLDFASPVVYTANISAFVNKDNDDLLRDLDGAIAKLQADGTFDEMKHYWLDDITDGGEGKAVRLKPTGKGTPLRVVHYAFSPPLSFLQSDETPSGYCAEAAIAIANTLDRQLDVRVVDYDAIIATVATGAADVAIDDIYALSQRAEFVSFTTPYLSQESYFFGQKVENATEGLAGFTSALKKNLIDDGRYELVISGLKTTVVVAFFAFLLATLLGLVLLVLSIRKNKTVDKLIALLELVIDGLPILVIVFIIYYIIFSPAGLPPTLSVIVALGIAYTPSVFEVLNEGIESVDITQVESARAMGFSALKTYRLVVLPQSFHWSFEKYISSFIDILKDTSIVGFVAVIDITRAIDFIRSQTFDATTPVIFAAVIYIFMVILLTALFRVASKRLVGNAHRRRVEK
jgi:polar amino acid transport system substrate-binding protein